MQLKARPQFIRGDNVVFSTRREISGQNPFIGIVTEIMSGAEIQRNYNKPDGMGQRMQMTWSEFAGTMGVRDADWYDYAVYIVEIQCRIVYEQRLIDGNHRLDWSKPHAYPEHNQVEFICLDSELIPFDEEIAKVM